jgi:glycolate oxidase
MEVRQADDEAQRAQLWAARKNVLPARCAAPAICMWPTVPCRAAPRRVLARVLSLSDEYGIAVAQSFHAGDGNASGAVL